MGAQKSYCFLQIPSLLIINISSRKRSLLSLLNEEGVSNLSQKNTNQRRKIICNCNKCNRLLVDYKTKVAYKSRIQQPLKKQSSDLSFHKLALSLQEQEEIGSPSSSQDLIEEIEEIEEVFNTLASNENEYIFKLRVRNLALNGFMSFNVDYENIAVEELGLNLAAKEVGLNLVKNNKTLDVYTEDDNFSETSTKSDEISDDNNNVFEDYSASDFEMP
ncbi:hypothetical protein F8M41_001459 [Gigaspora margarita]|uniref:Uncharacterized protein n=1 Tax=Gigaspora margarita TaxID=4874 RepID=A0A8H3XEE7_GIGMA|nr:hypothetical protein F8M41_001459 [Gigaspora margarita]